MDIRDRLHQTKVIDHPHKTNTIRMRHTMIRITNNRPHKIRVEDHLLSSDKILVTDQWGEEMGPHQINSQDGVGSDRRVRCAVFAPLMHIVRSSYQTRC